MELSEILKKDVYATLKIPKDGGIASKKNEKLTQNIEECWHNFLECSLGCDICGNGVADFFDTNLSELDNTFNLKDLKLKDLGTYFESTYYHVSRNVEDISKLQNLYVKVKNQKLNHEMRSKVTYCKYNKKPIIDTYSGISSVFDKNGSFEELENLEEIEEVKLCPICFHWYGLMMNGGSIEHFKKVNPFHILWYQYFEYDASQFLNFTDQQVKSVDEFLKLIDYYQQM